MATRQAALFDLPAQANVNPDTQGIKYAGSKLRLLPHILASVANLPVSVIFDGFSGSTRVSQAFAKAGYQVVSNDIAVWSETLATAFLLNKRPPDAFQKLIDHLNAVRPIDGWFSLNYGGLDFEGSAIQSDGTKRPWQLHNTRKLDGIREEIDRLDLEVVEKAVALTSLILALDKVDSTLGHYVSYLKEWAPRSYETMELRLPNLWVNHEDHLVTRRDVFSGIVDVSFDLAYYDPPYGSNNEKMPPSRVRYASYYHIWKTICLNDRPQVSGAARRRIDCSDRVGGSVFEDFRRDSNDRLIAVEAIRKLLRLTKARYIVLSYSSNGIATSEQLDSVIGENGHLIRTARIDHKRNVMAGMTWTNEWLREVEKKNTEFIFVIEKT